MCSIHFSIRKLFAIAFYCTWDIKTRLEDTCSLHTSLRHFIATLDAFSVVPAIQLFSQLRDYHYSPSTSLKLFGCYCYICHSKKKSSGLLIEISSLLFEATIEFVVFSVLLSIQNHCNFMFCIIFFIFGILLWFCAELYSKFYSVLYVIKDPSES